MRGNGPSAGPSAQNGHTNRRKYDPGYHDHTAEGAGRMHWWRQP